MPANPNWSRWVYASLAGHLHDAAGSLPTLVEGVDDRTDEFMQATARAEVRATGPNVHELSKNFWRVGIAANVVLTVHVGSPYRIQDLAGLFQAAMDQPIGVKKYGADEAHLGCLSPGKVTITHFGQTDSTNRILQATVDCSYTIDLLGV